MPAPESVLLPRSIIDNGLLAQILGYAFHDNILLNRQVISTLCDAGMAAAKSAAFVVKAMHPAIVEDGTKMRPEGADFGCSSAQYRPSTALHLSATRAEPTLRRPAGYRKRPEVPLSVEIIHADNEAVLPTFASDSFDLIYIDPPFNTGKAQARTQIKTVRDDDGDRTGFQGNRYRTVKVGTKSFGDTFNDYLAFLEPRLVEAHRLLRPAGSFFLHLDYREVHYAKVLLDQIFGRESFINEIVWSYDYGARATKRWSPKHDNILWYAKDPGAYTFRYDEIDRIPYMAPELCGPEKAERGKTPTDCWWNTIVSPNGKEKTGYPTQKPLSVIERIVRVHSNPGDRLLDFFAGSGTFGEAAAKFGRDVVLVDVSEEAVQVMKQRLSAYLSETPEVPVPCASAPHLGLFGACK